MEKYSYGSSTNGDSMDWSDLAQDGDKWWGVLNSAVNLQVL
jgi:hypothetical protein